MTNSHTDFLALFQELGLPANCTLDELKLAFRRRVSQLHPDRAIGRAADSESRLQRLTAMYNAALDFHRRYGRMPGNTAHATPAPPSRIRRPAPASSSANAPEAAPEPRRSHAVFAIVVVIVALVLFAWLLGESSDQEATDAIETPAPHAEAADAAPVAEPAGNEDTAASDEPAAPRHLRLGMSRYDVVALEGQPLSTNGPQWDYGPSWIAFRCGKVADWYSSPLRPLRTASTHPLSSDTMPNVRAVDCANDP
jgi:hypothetical protein